MTDTSTAPPITKAEFARLAALAWPDDPLKPLADKMAETTGFRLRTCQYWLQANSAKLPPDPVIRQALEQAMINFAAMGPLLDRLQRTPFPGL